MRYKMSRNKRGIKVEMERKNKKQISFSIWVDEAHTELCIHYTGTSYCYCELWK